MKLLNTSKSDDTVTILLPPCGGFPLVRASPDVCVFSLPTPSWILLFACNRLHFSISTCLFLIMVKCIQHKINLHHFYVYGSGALSTFIWSCGHQHRPSPELFSSCKTETLCPLNARSPFPRLPTLLGNHHAIFCVCEFDYAWCLIYMKLYNICLFVSGWFRLALGSQGSWCWNRCQSFLLHF